LSRAISDAACVLKHSESLKSFSSYHRNLIGQAYSVVQETGKLIPV